VIGGTNALFGTNTLHVPTTLTASNRYVCNLEGLTQTLANPLIYNTVTPVTGTRYYIHPDFTTSVCSGATFTYS